MNLSLSTATARSGAAGDDTSTRPGLRPRAPGRLLHLIESWHGARRRATPILADAVAVAALALAFTRSATTVVGCTIVVMVAGLVFGLYKPRLVLETQGIAWFPLRAIPVGLTLMVVLYAAPLHAGSGEAWQLALTEVGSLAALRALLWMVIGSARRRGRDLRPTLVIGTATQVEQIAHRIKTYPEAGLALEGVYTPGAAAMSRRPDDGWHLVERLLRTHEVDHVLFAVESGDEPVFRDMVRFAGGRVDCGLVLPVPGIAAHQTRAHLGDLPVIPIKTSPSSGSDLAKRVLDLALGVLALIATAPILLAVAAAIRLSDGGPAIFRQSRVGLDGRTFTIYKFRSMVVDAESKREDHRESNINPDGLLFKLEQDPRITPVGAIIRRLSIDELPQLLNVIAGSMSLVGPRPLPVEPDEFDVAAQIRHRVKPGITGLWQIHGANALPYGDMVDLDMTYVTTRSMGLDLVLLARTLPAVVFRRVRAI